MRNKLISVVLGYSDYGCVTGLQSSIVATYFKYFLHIWMNVAAQGLFLYLRLFVICFDCTCTSSDSHSNVTHFFHFFVYHILEICESAEDYFLSKLAWAALSALNYFVVIFRQVSLCLSLRITCFLLGNSYDR